jgi:hypothetical protein
MGRERPDTGNEGSPGNNQEHPLQTLGLRDDDPGKRHGSVAAAVRQNREVFAVKGPENSADNSADNSALG